MSHQLRQSVPRGVRVVFCRTCNARDRLVRDGRCVVCGLSPKAELEVIEVVQVGR